MEISGMIEKVKAGDADAFAMMYDLYWMKVYHFAQLYIYSPSKLADIVQDVFVKVWETRSFIDLEKNFDGFLFIITRNVLFECSRRDFNELNFKMTALRGLESYYNMEEELEAADLKSYIDSLIAQLPEKRQQVFRMSREEHLSSKEIAERCGVSEKAIERQITLALRYIKDNLPLFILFVRMI